MHFLLSLRFDILIAFGYEAISLKKDKTKIDIAELKGSILTRRHFFIQSMKVEGFFPSKEDFLIFLAENIKVHGMHSGFRKPIWGQLPLAVVRISSMIGIPPDYFIGFCPKSR
jgi:hypothetical protein